MRRRPASLVEAGQKETPYNAKLKACCAGRTSLWLKYLQGQALQVKKKTLERGSGGFFS